MLGARLGPGCEGRGHEWGQKLECCQVPGSGGLGRGWGQEIGLVSAAACIAAVISIVKHTDEAQYDHVVGFNAVDFSSKSGHAVSTTLEKQSTCL
jgi:hypothetical protein